MRRLALIATIPLVTLIGLVFMMIPSQPVTAQPIFATNTPQPPDALAITPEGNITQYALRLWTESEFIDVVSTALNRRDIPQDAIDVIMYDLLQRFPDAPRTFERRERLLNAMLNAPLGSVDMRFVVRPYIVQLFNDDPVSSGGGLTEIGRFTVDYQQGAHNIPNEPYMG